MALWLSKPLRFKKTSVKNPELRWVSVRIGGNPCCLLFEQLGLDKAEGDGFLSNLYKVGPLRVINGFN